MSRRWEPEAIYQQRLARVAQRLRVLAAELAETGGPHADKAPEMMTLADDMDAANLQRPAVGRPQ